MGAQLHLSFWSMVALQNSFDWARASGMGDPLSPFLFLLATIGLNVMSKVGIFSGYGVGGSSLFCILHFEFVVDALIMGEKSSENIRKY